MDWAERVRERLHWMETTEGVMNLRSHRAVEEFIDPAADLSLRELAPLLVEWWLELHEPFLVLLEALAARDQAPGVWAEALLCRIDWWNEEAAPLVWTIAARDLDRIPDPRIQAWAATLPEVRRRRGEQVPERSLPEPLPEAGTIAGLQARLDRLGWADLELTGVLDPPTREAVRCLQQFDRPDPETVDAQTFRAFLLPEEYDAQQGAHE